MRATTAIGILANICLVSSSVSIWYGVTYQIDNADAWVMSAIFLMIVGGILSLVYEMFEEGRP